MNRSWLNTSLGGAVLSCWTALALPVAPVTTTVYVGSHFEVRDYDQPTKYVFNGATRIASVTGSVSPKPRLQRIRLFPGWNLRSLAVTSPLLGQGGEIAHGLTSAVFKWDPATLGWRTAAITEAFTSGTVFWVQCLSNAMVAALGPYTDPVSQAIPAGGAYLPSAGLEQWSPDFPSVSSVWMYQTEESAWRFQMSAELASLSDLSLTVAPGEAVFVNSTDPAQVTPPEPAWRIRYYHPDHLSSSSAVTDGTGALLQEAAYLPFGERREHDELGGTQNPYQYIQKERDAESDLQFFEARFLAGGLSRFIRVDLLTDEIKKAWLRAPQRLNPYSYAQNNPVLYADPSGLDRFDRQDPELQKVMNDSYNSGSFSCGNGDNARDCVDRLSNREYAALTSVYQRMKERGLWKYVGAVTGIQTAGELSISFTVSDMSGFKDTLAGVRRTGPFDYSYGRRMFSQDEAQWNLFHSGSTSTRELSETDSLHVSIYTSGRVTAHVDQFSPVETDSGFYTSMNPTRGLIHQGREAGGPLVGDLMLRGLFRLPESFTLDPGLQFFPQQLPSLGPPANVYAAFTKSF